MIFIIISITINPPNHLDSVVDSDVAGVAAAREHPTDDNGDDTDDTGDQEDHHNLDGDDQAPH